MILIVVNVTLKRPAKFLYKSMSRPPHSSPSYILSEPGALCCSKSLPHITLNTPPYILLTEPGAPYYRIFTHITFYTPL